MVGRRSIGRVAAVALACLAAPSPATAQAAILEAAAGVLRLEVVAQGLHYPWSLVFLPDGAMLVSEKLPGRLRRVTPDGRVSEPLAGLPPIFADGNGGLLGLALDPAFGETRRLYFAYSEPGAPGTAGLAVARASLHEDRLSDVEVIFRQQPKVADIRNFGGRLLFAPDGTLFVLTGDRFAMNLAQDPRTTIGKMVRIRPDGSPPPDNPFVGRLDADPVVWSLGHRNLGGAAFHPETGRLWTTEYGPWGGDELNVAEPGGNYGWPLVSWGRHYEGEDIPDPPTRPDLLPSVYHWNPVISPADMAFHRGGTVPDWRGDLLIAGLTAGQLVRLTLRGEQVIAEERMTVGSRLRSVVEGPDGALYLLTDEPDGEVLRVVPE